MKKLQIGAWFKAKLSTLLRHLERPTPQTATDNMGMPPPARGDRAFRLTGILTAAILVMVAIFGAALGMRIYGIMGLGSSHYKNIPVVYVKSDSILCFSHPYLEEPVTVNTDMDTSINDSRILSETVHISENGRAMLYFESVNGPVGRLYFRECWNNDSGNPSNDNKGILISRAARPNSVSFSQNDRSVVYQRRETGRATDLLCRWTQDYGEEIIAENCIEVQYILDNGDICYLAAQNGSRALMLLKLPNKKGLNEPPAITTVDNKLLSILSADEGRVLYTKRAEDGIDLFRLENGVVTTLATDADEILDIGEKGETFYTQASDKVLDPMIFFDDDMQAADDLLREPTEAAFTTERKGLWGNTIRTVDTKAFEAAVERYEEKLKRDSIREAIAARSQSYKSYTLVHQLGSSRTYAGVDLQRVVAADAAETVAVYYKERSSISEKFKISRIVDETDALRLLNTALENTVRDYYYLRVGAEPVLFQTVTHGDSLQVWLDGRNGLYFIGNERTAASDGSTGNGGPLYYAPLGDGELGLAKKLDDNVLSMDERSWKEQRIYIKHSDNDTVDLYSVSDGKKSLLLRGLSSRADWQLQNGTLFGYRDYDTSNASGELVMLSSKVKPVASGVWGYSYRTSDYLYLLTDYDSVTGTGNLCLYTGSGQRMRVIDRNVSALVMQPQGR